MSDNIKLIVEIPKNDYKAICENKEDAIIAHDTCRRIANNGISLDSVKAEIFDKAIKDASGEGFIFLGRLLRIFDNIGKAESEGTE